MSVIGPIMHYKKLGVATACSAVALVLHGCGTTPAPTSTPPVPTQPPPYQPQKACFTGWDAPSCCCMTCDDAGGRVPVFAIQDNHTCFMAGGQCKPHNEVFPDGEGFSSYQRPPVSVIEDATELGTSTGASQFHLIGGHPDEIVIVFLMPGDKEPQTVELLPVGASIPFVTQTTVATYSAFRSPGGWNGFASSQRGSEYHRCFANGRIDYTNSTCYYTSEIIHQAHFTGLTPGTTYKYKLQTDDTERTFKTPPRIGDPMNIAWTADLGQTSDALKTMQMMRAQLDNGNIDLCVFPGDLSYADGYADDWDRYGRISEFLWSELPTAYGVGNHETTSGLENFAHFTPRYGWTSRRSAGTSSNWYSFDSGLAHIVTLCSYCHFTKDSAQYSWLKADLESIDRTQTPWVIVNEHTPWYTSNMVHPFQTEGKQMRSQMEDLLFQHQVDFVFSGHVHAYERTHNVYNLTRTCNGPVYITIGDGGNHEGPECGWQPGPDGSGFDWSARKEFSFGFGILSIPNATNAHWAWHRNQDGEDVAFDFADFKPARANCPTSYVTV